MGKKFVGTLAIAILLVCFTACDKEEHVKSEPVSREMKENGPGILTMVDNSKLARDVQNCDTLRITFEIVINDPQVLENVKRALEELTYLCFEVKVIDDVPEITCQNSTDVDDVIQTVKTQLTYLSGPSLKEDLDGSQIVQTQYYVVVSKDYSVSVYISGEGKTLEDLLNDTDCDGIYQCAPDVCSEYSEE